MLELLDFRRRDQHFPLGISSDCDIPFKVVDFLKEGGLGLQVVSDEGTELISPTKLLADGVAVRDEVVLPDDFA
jgi:hypothetical protein